MSSDHRTESELNALRTETRVDSSVADDATNALRDRLRLRLTVHNVVPGLRTPALESAPNEQGERVWNSVLESLSTSLNAVDTSRPPALPALPNVQVPAIPQPSISPLFSPQPLPIQQTSLRSTAHQQASVHAVGGQIYVPAGLTEYQPVLGDVALLPQGEDDVNSSLYLLESTSIVAPNVGGTGMPFLGQPVRPVMPQRVAQSRITHVPLPVQHVSKKKRRPFRAFFSLLVVASLLAGAGFTGWYFLIKKKVVWSEDIAPLAAFVEQTTHAKFVENVPVTLLSVPEFEVKLGIDVLARSYSDPDGSFGTLRAVGLVSGTPAPSEVGHIAAATVTSFYSAPDRVIYRIAGTTPAFEMAMLRSLSVAIADQKTDWSKGTAALTDAQRIGIRATVDAVGAEVVRARFKQDSELEGLVAYEVQARINAGRVASESRPTYLNAVLGSYVFGARASPVPSSDHLLSGIYVPASDAPMFDPIRSSASPATGTPSPGLGRLPRTLGMQFWYLVLLPTVGPVHARLAALTWTGDSVVTSTTEGRSCLAANVATSGNAEQAVFSDAMTRWAATRPASSAALVSSPVQNVVGLSVCEPAEPTSQPVGPGDASLWYSAPLLEENVAAELVKRGLPATQSAWSCAISFARNGAVPNFIVGSTDQAQADALSNVLNYCKAT